MKADIVRCPRIKKIHRDGLFNKLLHFRIRDAYFIYIVLSISIIIIPLSSANGQVLPSFDPTGRSGDRRPELLEEKPPAPPPTVTVPSTPMPAKEPPESLLRTVFVHKIVVTGSSVFSPEEISKVTAPYENRNVTMEALESLRRALTLLYVNKGYVNSGAVIPDQKVVDGVITLKIIEGKLTHIDVEGNKWFREAFLKDRIALGADPPVNVSPLQDRLQLLQQDQRIERIHAELRPGTKPGESELKVRVEEKPPFYTWLAVNNYQHPSVGAVRELLTLAHQNLTGHADILSFTYGRSEGLNPMIDTWYVVPLNVYDTTMLIRYRKNDFDVITDQLKSLDIENKSEFYEITLRQPVYRTLNQEFALAVSLEYERSETYLSGMPFSFYPGVENGKSVVIPLRFAQEWTYRTQRQVFAVRSRFTFGLDTGDATIHDDNQPDGKFIAWLGQFQWARVLDFLDTQLLFRADIQRSNDSLLPLEQISVGGRYSVRGYRESTLVRDQAFIASLEARVPLIQHMRWADYIQICPFYDYGRGSYKSLAYPGPVDISSVGVGLRWSASLIKSPLNLRADLETYWGYALRDINLPHEDLQDNGIHYQFAITGSF